MPELIESFLIISAQLEYMSLYTKSRLSVPLAEGVRKSRNGRGQKEPLISIRFVWHGEDVIVRLGSGKSKCYMPSRTG